jgi:hypothetical protein
MKLSLITEKSLDFFFVLCIQSFYEEPRAKSQEPRAKSQEPRAKSQEPRAKSQEPRAHIT